MKIIALEINCIRGIKNLKLSFNQENAVVYGDNGTGKSGVIDAIDFLLRGEISRITGSGTGNLNIQEHGKHVKSEKKEAWVSALVKLPDIKDPIEIKRTLLNPNKLECPEEHKNKFDEIEKIAKLQAHFLSRREITKYISATDANRAKEIENLLNLDSLSSNRKILQKICNETKSEYDAKIKTLGVTESDISKVLLCPKSEWLNAINEKREKLGCKKLEELIPENLTSGIDISKDSEVKTLITTQLNLLNNLKNEIHSETGLIKNLQQMENTLSVIKELEQADMILDNLSLYKTAIKSIKDEVCPVCEQEIKSKDALIEKLEDKIAKLKSLADYSSKRTISYNNIKTNVTNIIKFFNNEYEKIRLLDPLNEIEKIKSSIEYLNKLNIEDFSIAICNEVCTKVNIENIIEKISTDLAKQLAKISIDVLQLEYRSLSDISGKLSVYNSTIEEVAKYKIYKDKIDLIYSKYQQFQDEVLNDLYKTIEERFSYFYRLMHSKDESSFNAEFNKSGSTLQVNVEFHDGKKYPPNAVHSEGHQDSMGICLFFALSEIIENNKLDVILLDDVVMSIDMDHRISFCKLIKEVFPTKQFIITTHDFIWKKELETQQVAKKDNIFYFRAWDIDNGPLYEKISDVWVLIKDNLDKGNKNEAVGKLRYVLEEHFNYFCQKYSLPVPYSANGKWTLEQVLNPSHSFIIKTLNAALETSKHYKKDTTSLESLIDNYKVCFSEFNSDRWTLNPATHFTQWAQNLSIDELRKLLESAEKYCNILICPDCKKEATINVDNGKPKSIICNCGKISYSCAK